MQYGKIMKEGIRYMANGNNADKVVLRIFRAADFFLPTLGLAPPRPPVLFDFVVILSLLPKFSLIIFAKSLDNTIATAYNIIAGRNTLHTRVTELIV